MRRYGGCDSKPKVVRAGGASEIPKQMGGVPCIRGLRIPVATVAIDGAVNAAVLAVQILAATDEDIRKRLREFKESLGEELKL